MKLTTERLKKLIREELSKINEEAYNAAYEWWNADNKKKYTEWVNNPDLESTMLKQCAEETGMTEEECREALRDIKHDALG